MHQNLMSKTLLKPRIGSKSYSERILSQNCSLSPIIELVSIVEEAFKSKYGVNESSLAAHFEARVHFKDEVEGFLENFA